MDIKLNQDEFTIQVNMNNETIARGTWTVDIPDKTILVNFHEFSLPSPPDEELRKFLNDIEVFYRQIYNAKIIYSIPMLVNRKMIPRERKDMMGVEKKNLKQFQHLHIDQNRFSITTDKKEMYPYLTSLTEMLCKNAFWLEKTNENDVKNRIDSASKIVMILYKDTNNATFPVGFVRLLTNMDQNLTYVSDVTVAESQQSQGLASYMLNRLFEVFLGDNVNEKDGFVCLMCVDRGSGMHSAPKLYKKFGFEFLIESEKNIPLFINGDCKRNE